MYSTSIRNLQSKSIEANRATTTTVEDEDNLLSARTRTRTRTKSRTNIINSTSVSLKKVFYLVTSLKLTFTATATTYSASSILKSLLIGFYYLTAFTSVLLLITYINHAITTQQEAKQSVGPEKVVSFDSMVNHISALNSLELIRIKRSSSAAAAAASDSIEEKAFESERRVLPASLLAGRHSVKGGRQSTFQPAKSIVDLNGEKNQFAGKQEALPELSERQATGSSYSSNNRGTIHHNAQQPAINLTRSQETSQWIPMGAGNSRLVQPPPPPPAQNHKRVTQKQQQQQQQQQPTRQTSRPQRLPVVNRPAPMSMAPSTIGIIESAYPFDEEPLYQEYNSGPRQNRNRHWRRPRLNYDLLPAPRPPPMSRFYKRVLLCDKTLVCLDYVRAFSMEPRPNFYDEDDLNAIDIDPNILDRRQMLTLDSAPPSFTTTTTTTTSNLTDLPARSSETTESTLVLETDPILEERGGFMNFHQHHHHHQNNNHLSDQDLLVKCDMWDLEKGLKNRKPPPEVLRMAIRADFDTVRDAINRCRQLSEKTLPPDDEFRNGELEIPISSDDLFSLFSVKRGLIPGTKWCGLGDRANSYNDLGSKHRIDICCRAHDHCPIRLKPFRNDYGVLNIALYTKSHCDCDADFYRCLREVHSRTADMLGNLYFNVMKLQCMREERMKVCREMKPIALGFERCVKYGESPYKRVFKFTTPPVAY